MSDKYELLIAEAEAECAENFKKLGDIALINSAKVLTSFRKNKVSTMHFNATTGYGYDDQGRDMLSRLYADIFSAEDAIVSPLLANGTSTISAALFGVLRPGDTLLSITGKPYDTLDEVIIGENIGSLKDFGIQYAQIDYKNGKIDIEQAVAAVKEIKPKVVFMQRSKGYLWQNALTAEEIGEASVAVKSVSDVIIMVDNCYGEFAESKEPTDFGVDLAVGSLIKNAGGGFAPTGGYIVGKSVYVDLIGRRMTAPSEGREVGSYFSSYLPYFQGLFMAPITVKNALMGTVLAVKLFEKLGYETLPSSNSLPGDIICAIKFNDEQKLIRFCQAVQRISPVDSHVVPYPWDMPGYKNQVIMAAGTFIQGASLELTADAPIKEPYIGYLQGGLTYEHVKLALTEICRDIF